MTRTVDARSFTLVYLRPERAPNVEAAQLSEHLPGSSIENFDVSAAPEKYCGDAVDCVVADTGVSTGTVVEELGRLPLDDGRPPVVLVIDARDGTVPAVALDRSFADVVPVRGGGDPARETAEAVAATVPERHDPDISRVPLRDTASVNAWKANILDQYFTKIPVHMYVKDERANHVMVSEGAVDRRIHRYGGEYLGHRDIDGIVPHAEAQEPYADDLYVLETGRSIHEKEEYYPESDRWFLTSKAPWVDEDGEPVGVLGLTQEITDPKRQERELRESERRYRTLLEMSPVPIFVHRDGRIVYTNNAMVDLIGADEQGDVLGTTIDEYVDTDEHGDVLDVVDRIQRGEQTTVANPYTVVTLDGVTRYVETTSRPIAYEGAAAVLTIAKDVTSRHEYEQTLRALHRRTRELMLSESSEDAAETAVTAAVSLLDLPEAVVYRFDSDESRLDPVATSADVDARAVEPPSVSGRDGGPLWEAFATGDQSFLDGDEHGTGVGPDTPSRRALVVPLGTHGIFVVGGTNGPLPQTTVDLASVLADNLETTFDRLEKERRLRTQERRLVEQNRELSRLNQLNEVIRNTNRALIRATSREAIERKVCEKLADAEPVVGAWIASFDEPGGGLDPVSVRGLDEEHLDELLAGGEGPVSGLAQTARRKAAVGIARGLFDDEAWRRRRRHVLTAGYTAVAAVPIVVRDAVERVLFLHVSDDELLRGGEAVLGELGQVVGSAIETVGNRRALLTDRNLQVDLTVADESFVFTRLSGRTGHDLDVRGIVPREDGSVVAFLTTHAPVEDVLSFAERTQVITDVAALSDESDDGETLFRVDINASVFDLLAKYDASLRSLTADGETTAMSVDLPEGVHVREFVEDLRTRYDGVELTARRQQADSVEAAETLPAMFESRCTDRQFEALETAYYGGFYEWPRQSNNADLAEVLGVSSPTYQAHRRAAERKLVAAVFT